MALGDNFRAICYAARAIPGQLGLRPHTVSLIEGTNLGPQTGDFTGDYTETPIVESDSQPPKVRWLNDEQLALANLGGGAVDVGPITSFYTTGGTDLAQLAGQDLEAGDTLHIKITGPKHPTGALYRVTKITAHRALHYMLRCSPVRETI